MLNLKVSAKDGIPRMVALEVTVDPEMVTYDCLSAFSLWTSSSLSKTSAVSSIKCRS